MSRRSAIDFWRVNEAVRVGRGTPRSGRGVRGLFPIVAAIALVATACGTARGTGSLASSAKVKVGPPLTLAGFSPYTGSWTSNEFSPDFLPYLTSLALLPLAFPTPKFGQYVPELATSWKVAPGSLTIKLRKVHWQDGRAFTSSDVIDTLLLEGVDGNQMWDSITSLSAPNDSTVLIKLRSGSSPEIVLNDVIEVYPVPASQYGRFVTSNLQAELIAQDKPGGSPNKSISSDLKKFAPKTLVGDGPFQLSKVTTNVTRLVRWPGFWDAGKVHVSAVDAEEFSNEDAFYPALYSHEMDLAQASIPGNVKSRWTHEPGSGYVAMNNFAQSGIYFNDRKYPLNLLGVRQAIAYIVNRKKMTYLDSGDAPQGPWVRHPDGVIAPQSAFLSSSQIKSLNQYLPSTQKATALLDHLGFKKKGGQWYTPKGKRLTFTIVGPAGWTNSIQDTIVVADELTKFGIKTTGSIGEQPGYWTNLTDGAFDLIWGWGGFGVDPLQQLSYVFSTYDYNAPSEPGIGYGPMATVPGLGKVNLHKAVLQEYDTVPPGPKMKHLVWLWARFVNQHLPYLSTWDKYQQVEFSTKDYTDWPALSSEIWQIAGVAWPGVLTIAMQRGYIHPR